MESDCSTISLETFDFYNSMYPQENITDEVLKAIPSKHLRSISVRNPERGSPSDISQRVLDLSQFSATKGNACEYLDLSYNNLVFVYQSLKHIVFCQSLKLLDLSHNNLMLYPYENGLEQVLNLANFYSKLFKMHNMR